VLFKSILGAMNVKCPIELLLYLQIQPSGSSETSISSLASFFFDVLLTVHLSIILVINQLNAQILVL